MASRRCIFKVRVARVGGGLGEEWEMVGNGGRWWERNGRWWERVDRGWERGGRGWGGLEEEWGMVGDGPSHTFGTRTPFP